MPLLVQKLLNTECFVYGCQHWRAKTRTFWKVKQTVTMAKAALLRLGQNWQMHGPKGGSPDNRA